MYKIKFSLNVQNYLSKYFKHYRKYYETLYEDSGLLSEEQIINGYINESKNRKKEIIETIKNYLSRGKIMGEKLNNTIFLKWRSKYIFVNWIEDKTNKIRYILNIEIR